MELVLKNQSVQFEKHPSVEEVVGKINELLADNYFFSHLIVDGVLVYDDPVVFLSEELLTIEKLEVVARMATEFTNDILLSAEEYLTRATPEMTILADGFYQSPQNEQWTNFTNMLDGVQWLNQIITTIDKMEKKPGNWVRYIQLNTTLEMHLQTLNEAVKDGDTVLIADIIQYELIPLFETLKKEVQTTIDIEGTRNDVN